MLEASLPSVLERWTSSSIYFLILKLSMPSSTFTARESVICSSWGWIRHCCTRTWLYGLRRVKIIFNWNWSGRSHEDDCLIFIGWQEPGKRVPLDGNTEISHGWSCLSSSPDYSVLCNSPTTKKLTALLGSWFWIRKVACMERPSRKRVSVPTSTFIMCFIITSSFNM